MAAASAEPCSSYSLLQLLISSELISSELTTSNTPWTSFSTHSSEKAALAFQVSKTRHNSRMKHNFDLRIKIQENMTIDL